jgi:F0F1-type ATP synthase alpha subunit
LRPAIDIGRSVSRIGAVAQSPAMRKAAKNLKIQLSRFESLEKLSRVGLDIDVTTQATLREGNLLRAILRQKRFSPRSITHQVIAMTAVAEHWISDLKPMQAVAVIDALVDITRRRAVEIADLLDAGELPKEGWKTTLLQLVPEARSRIVSPSIAADVTAESKS